MWEAAVDSAEKVRGVYRWEFQAPEDKLTRYRG